MLVGRVMSSLGSYLIFFTDRIHLHPLATALLTSGLALPFSIFLRETRGQAISN